MDTYIVNVSRETRWWVIEVQGLPLGFSQALRLSDVEPTVRELIAAHEDRVENSFDLDVRVNLASVAPLVETADRLRAAAVAAKAVADRATRQAATALKHEGVPVRDVATLLHVSPAWAGKLANDPAVAAAEYTQDRTA